MSKLHAGAGFAVNRGIKPALILLAGVLALACIFEESLANDSALKSGLGVYARGAFGVAAQSPADVNRLYDQYGPSSHFRHAWTGDLELGLRLERHISAGFELGYQRSRIRPTFSDGTDATLTLEESRVLATLTAWAPTAIEGSGFFGVEAGVGLGVHGAREMARNYDGDLVPARIRGHGPGLVAGAYAGWDQTFASHLVFRVKAGYRYSRIAQLDVTRSVEGQADERYRNSKELPLDFRGPYVQLGAGLDLDW